MSGANILHLIVIIQK